jgi:hypothetical protein
MGLTGTIVIAVTLIVTAIAARAAHRSADAAFINAQAVINAERPHLIFGDDIEVIGIKHRFAEKPYERRYEDGDGSRLLIATYHFVNRGKTPCQIEYSSHWLVLGDLPSVPDYEPTEQVPGVWIGPNQSLLCPAECKPNMLSGAQRAAVLANKTPLYLIGKVVYKSVFEERHIIRIAYRYRPDVDGHWFAIEDAPAYWEYT